MAALRSSEIAREHRAIEEDSGNAWRCECQACRIIRLRSEAGRKGGKARAKSFTRAYQRKARSCVKRKNLQRNGVKSARIVIERYGHEKLFEACRSYRLNKPSQPELLMMGILSTLKLEFEREWRIASSFYTVDFKLSYFNKSIAVHGNIHDAFNQDKRAFNEARKLSLLSEQEIECLIITERELRDVPAVIEKIKAFVNGA